MTGKIILTVFGMMCIMGVSLAQTPQNFATWSGYEGYHPFYEGSRWGLFAEGYAKRNDGFSSKMGWFYRFGATYYLKNGNRISGGYAFQYNYPYDSVSPPYGFSDYRIWQQFMWRIPTRSNPDHLWVQRFRLEERWLGEKDNAEDPTFDYNFETTFRYMIRSQWWITPRFGAALYDELHLRIMAEEVEHLLDQNRIYAGILISLDKKHNWRFETGYMFQSIWNAPDQMEGRKRMNHTWRFTITSDGPFTLIKN